MKATQRGTCGFTLVELMVTLVIAVVLMAAAAPSFITFQRNAELTSYANTLVAAINAARGEAIKRGRAAMVVPQDGTSWSSGLRVFVDMDRSQDFTTDDTTVFTRDASPSYLTVSGNNTAQENPPYILFDASGYSKTKAGGFGALSFTIARNDVDTATAASETRRVVIASTGRVRVCKPSTDTSCTGTASK